MFIEVTTSGGRGHAQMVESFRNEAGKPRQRTLAPLDGLPSKRCTATRKASDSHSTTDQTTPMSSAR